MKSFLFCLSLCGIFLFYGCDSCSESDCECSVVAEQMPNKSIQVSWSHSCLQCSTWEVCYKKTGFFNTYDCFVTNDLGYPALGSSSLFNSLDSNTEYKFCVKGNSGNACNSSTIGETTITTD